MLLSNKRTISSNVSLFVSGTCDKAISNYPTPPFPVFITRIIFIESEKEK